MAPTEPSYPEGGIDTSNNTSITRDEKIDKARQVMGMEEGSTITINADDKLLATLGYRAELKREFSYLTVFGQSFGAMGIAPAIAESMVGLLSWICWVCGNGVDISGWVFAANSRRVESRRTWQLDADIWWAVLCEIYGWTWRTQKC